MGEFFIKVKLANEHILALTNHGDVYAWGTNTYGQVGIEQNED
jgi:alpha-tubulin suppressor-like RCC1 family protein